MRSGVRGIPHADHSCLLPAGGLALSVRICHQGSDRSVKSVNFFEMCDFEGVFGIQDLKIFEKLFFSVLLD